MGTGSGRAYVCLMLKKIFFNVAFFVLIFTAGVGAALFFTGETAGFRNCSGIVALVALVLFACVYFLSFYGKNKQNKKVGQGLDVLSCLAGDESRKVFSGLGLNQKICVIEKSLRELFNSISLASGGIQKNCSESTEAVAGIASTAEVINGSVEGIYSEVRHLAELVGDVKTKINSISNGMVQHISRMETQAAHVTGTNTQVGRILEAIQGITEETSYEKAATENLVKSASEGKEVFSETLEKIAKIGDSIEQIKSMVAIIDDVAENTNLLAMNAAIEAAHAGTMGKGFAVVAEEIRKLSMASRKSSGDIAQFIKEITETIKTAVGESKVMEESFAAIEKNVGVVSDAVTKVYGKLEETNDSSKQILNTLSSLEGLTSEILKDSSKMNEESLSIKSVMGELDMCSFMVHDEVQAISLMMGGFKEIGDTVSLKNAAILENNKFLQDKFCSCEKKSGAAEAPEAPCSVAVEAKPGDDSEGPTGDASANSISEKNHGDSGTSLSGSGGKTPGGDVALEPEPESSGSKKQGQENPSQSKKLAEEDFEEVFF